MSMAVSSASVQALFGMGLVPLPQLPLTSGPDCEMLALPGKVSATPFQVEGPAYTELCLMSA